MNIPKLNWTFWWRGLVGAIIGGCANAILVTLIAPEAFNIGPGLVKLVQLAAGAGIIGAAQWLKQHPLPPEEGHKE